MGCLPGQEGPGADFQAEGQAEAGQQHCVVQPAERRACAAAVGEAAAEARLKGPRVCVLAGVQRTALDEVLFYLSAPPGSARSAGFRGGAQ